MVRQDKRKYINIAINALLDKKGDDTERAKIAFRGLSAEKMDEKYGVSGGTTRRKVLEGYIKCDEKIDEVIEWLRSLGGKRKGGE
jgi:hypothetical protein